MPRPRATNRSRDTAIGYAMTAASARSRISRNLTFALAGISITLVGRSQSKRPWDKHIWVVAGQDARAAVLQPCEPISRFVLRLQVVDERRKLAVVEAAREMNHVAADHQIADPHRLMTWRVSGRRQQLNRTVAKQIAVAFQEFDWPCAARVIAWHEEVTFDRLVVVRRSPFGSLHDDRSGLGELR